MEKCDKCMERSNWIKSFWKFNKNNCDHTIILKNEIWILGILKNIKSKKIALITGATSGIGEATAKKLASKFSLILCGRRQEKLTVLSKSLSNLTTVKTLTFDVRDKDDVAAKFKELEGKWKNIDILINNAGNAHGMDFIHEGDIEDWDMMIDTNVKGLLYVSKEVLKIMVKNNRGHIINIGSIAGKEVYPKGNIYCAS